MSKEAQITRPNAPAFVAYHAPERENAPWTAIGAAWNHKDGNGLTLQLNLVPATHGRIVLRKATSKGKYESA